MTGAYIHIPFCKQKCKYCDFNSYSGMTDMSYSYADALIKEIETAKLKLPDTKLSSIYIGGGTPTYIDTALTEEIVEAVKNNFSIKDDAEITIECNPGTADFEKLSRLRKCGINRLSIGMQSSADDMLKSLGRVHNYNDFLECFKSARNSGFENISVDLMFGLPNQSLDLWKETLEKTAELEPEHISAYSLKIEEGTPFWRLFNDGNLDLPDDDKNREMYDFCVNYLDNNGYNRYEISNFAKPGYESRHNLLYWNLDDYIGFGAGAYSCIGKFRFNNERSVSGYIDRVNNSGSGIIEIDKTAEYERMCEFVFLGLRLDRGISKKKFMNMFGKDIFDVFGKQLNKHINLLKTMEEYGDIIKIKSDYIYVSNIILSDFV